MNKLQNSYNEQQGDTSQLDSSEQQKYFSNQGTAITSVRKQRINLSIKLKPIESQTKNLLQEKGEDSMRIEQKNEHLSKISASTFHTNNVRNHVYQFANALNYRRYLYNHLRSTQHQLIGDNAFDLESADPDTLSVQDPYMKKYSGTYWLRKIKRKIYNLYRRFINLYMISWLTSCFNHIFTLIPVFEPEYTTNNSIWAIIMFFVQSYFLVLIPMQLVFNNQVMNYYLYTISTCFSSLCFFDIFLKFNTGFVYNGVYIQKRNRILINLLNCGIYVDIIANLIVLGKNLNLQHQTQGDIKSYEDWTQYLMLLYFSQVRDVWRRKRVVEMQLNLSLQVKSYYKILKLLLSMLFIEHLFSCIWLLIAFTENAQNSTTWLMKAEVVDDDWKIQYLTALYYSIVTLTSVGYGDIYPQSIHSNLQKAWKEKIFSCIILLISSIQLSFTISQIGTVMLDVQSSQSQVTKKLRIMLQYMKKHGVSKRLQHTICDYLERFWSQITDFEEQDHMDIMKDLPYRLREMLKTETAMEMVQRIPFLHDNFAVEVKKQLRQCIQPVNVLPDHEIPQYKPGEPSNTYLYYVDSGSVDEFVSLENFDVIKTKQVIKSGEHFGLESFIIGEPQKVKLRSQGFCRLFRLARADVIRVFKNFPKSLEFVNMIRDRLLFDEHFDLNQSKCVHCKGKYHSVAVCPSLHYVADKEFIIKRHNFPVQQERQLFFRNRKREHAFHNTHHKAMKASSVVEKVGNPMQALLHTDSEEEQNNKQVQTVMPKQIANKFVDKTKYTTSQNHLGDYVQVRIKRLLHRARNKLRVRISKQDLDNLEFLNQTLKQKKVESDFDRAKNYTEYMPWNNLIKVLEDYKHPAGINNRLILYMTYPKLKTMEYFQIGKAAQIVLKAQRKASYSNFNSNSKSVGIMHTFSSPLKTINKIVPQDFQYPSETLI